MSRKPGKWLAALTSQAQLPPEQMQTRAPAPPSNPMPQQQPLEPTPPLFSLPETRPRNPSAEEIQNSVFIDTLLGRAQPEDPLGQSSPLFASRQTLQSDADAADNVDSGLRNYLSYLSTPTPIPPLASATSFHKFPGGSVKSPLSKRNKTTEWALLMLQNIATNITNTQKCLRRAKTPEDVAWAKIGATQIGDSLAKITTKKAEVVAKKREINLSYQQLLGQCTEELLRRPMLEPILVDAGELQNRVKQ